MKNSRMVWLLCICLAASLLLVGQAAGQSEDISRIAFASDRDGNTEIYVMDTDGGNVQRLTNNPATDATPNWSPDGKQIAFVSDRAEAEVFDIYLMDAAGDDLVRLTEGGGSNPTWSPDGKHIIFNSMPASETYWNIYIMDADGKNQARLTSSDLQLHKLSVSWSPDGTTIAFSGCTEPGSDCDIFIMDVDGQHVQNLTNSPDTSEFVLDWSPNSTLISFVADMGLGYSGYSLAVESGDIQPFTASDGTQVLIPSWSPDSNYIVFNSEAGEIYVMDADGENVRNLTNNPAFDFSPNWSSGEVPPVAAVVVTEEAETHTQGGASDGTVGAAKPGQWEGTINNVGFPGNLRFVVRDDGTISDFTIRIPVFGKEQQGCESTLQSPIAI